MSSNVCKTQIIRVESNSDNESSLSSLSSDSDHELEDERYVITEEDNNIPKEALDVFNELLIKNNFNNLEIIQKKSTKDVNNSTIVCHSLLIDRKIDNQTIDGLNDLNDIENKYVFRSKSKLLKELEIKSKQKVISKEDKKSKNSIKSDLQINTIPKTFEEFLQIILELNAILIEDQNSRLFFSEETHNREIRFRSHSSYLNAFIPFVIREFWTHLKKSRKQEVSYHSMAYKKVTENEIICSHIRDKSLNQSVFKFGQIVVIKYSLIESNLETNSETESKLMFGFVREVRPKLIGKTTDLLSHPLIQSQFEDNESLFEEIIIYCNPLPQNFETVSVMPLTCSQKYLMEARIVCELKDEKFSNIFAQVLKPNFTFGVTGLSVNLEHRKDLFDIQKDSIQKAYEVCCVAEMVGNPNNIVAIAGPPKTGKTEVLKESILQLIKLSDIKINKLLVITNGTEEIKSIIEFLKRNDIKVYHIDSEVKCLSHSKHDFKRLIRKMNKEFLFEDIVTKDDISYERCLRFYNEEIQLKDMSIKDKFVREQIELKVINKLMTESQVVIGSIASIMNDEMFNMIYNSNNDNNISSALIDNAHSLTETEILTLLYTGVQGFALFGDSVKNPISYENCESFFQRYVRLYNKNCHQIESKSHSVVYLRETIESLQRYSKISHNSDRNQSKFGHQPNRPFSTGSRGRLNAYRNQSNYGSEYFRKRSKDNIDVKYEDKSDNKPFAQYNSYPLNDSKPNHLIPPDPQYNRFPNNMMTDGIGSQMAFGNRGSYLNQTPNPNNSYHNQSYDSNSNNMSDMSGADTNTNIPYYGQNRSSFVPNNSNHQNYNLF